MPVYVLVNESSLGEVMSLRVVVVGPLVELGTLSLYVAEFESTEVKADSDNDTRTIEMLSSEEVRSAGVVVLCEVDKAIPDTSGGTTESEADDGTPSADVTKLDSSVAVNTVVMAIFSVLRIGVKLVKCVLVAEPPTADVDVIEEDSPQVFKNDIASAMVELLVPLLKLGTSMLENPELCDATTPSELVIGLEIVEPDTASIVSGVRSMRATLVVSLILPMSAAGVKRTGGSDGPAVATGRSSTRVVGTPSSVEELVEDCRRSVALGEGHGLELVPGAV